MSTYSDLKIELIGTGEQDGTWGTTTNVNLGTSLEEMITGSADVTFASATKTLTLTNTNATQVGRNLRLNLTGTSGGAQDLVLPALAKLYLIYNGTADIITCKNASGTTVAVPAGASQYIWNSGSNVTVATNYHTGTFTGAGAFTTLSASSTVSGAGITARFATPGPIGDGAPSTGNFTTLGATGTVTLGNASGDTVTHNAGTVTIPNDLIYSGTGAITQAVGTELQRPGSATAGMFRYNSDSGEFEGYTDAWGSIGGGASAGGAIYENTQTIAANYTLTTNTNGMSVGPITINTGVTVTVPSGSNWVVL
jgi:hypothetical protein